MKMVTLECRECATSTTFASEFEPHEATKIEDMQQHMDVNFVARCGSCFGCDWEVTAVEKYKKPEITVRDYVRGMPLGARN